jgi:hypothetical protein
LPRLASPAQTFREERDGSALSDAAHEVIDSWLGVRFLEPTNALGGFIDSAKMPAQALSRVGSSRLERMDISSRTM